MSERFMNDESRRKVKKAFGNGVDTLQEEIQNYLYPLYKKIVVARVEGKLHLTIVVSKNPIFGYPAIALIRIFVRLGEAFRFTYEDNTPKGSNDALISIVIKGTKS